MKPDSFAIINLSTVDGFVARPAAFVFKTAEGIARVEPGYNDPYGSTRPADHYLTGSVIQLPGDLGLSVERHGKVIATVISWTSERAREDAESSCGRALCDFGDYLIEQSVTLDEERQRVEIQLGLNT